MSPSIRDSLKFFQAGLSSATQCVKPEARELVGEYDRTGYAARSSARARRQPGRGGAECQGAPTLTLGGHYRTASTQ